MSDRLTRMEALNEAAIGVDTLERARTRAEAQIADMRRRGIAVDEMTADILARHRARVAGLHISSCPVHPAEMMPCRVCPPAPVAEEAPTPIAPEVEKAMDWIERARGLKVGKLVRVLDAHFAALGSVEAKEASEAVAALDASGWAETARLAGCRVPSDETKAAVVVVYQRRTEER